MARALAFASVRTKNVMSLDLVESRATSPALTEPSSLNPNGWDLVIVDLRWRNVGVYDGRWLIYVIDRGRLACVCLWRRLVVYLGWLRHYTLSWNQTSVC